MLAGSNRTPGDILAVAAGDGTAVPGCVQCASVALAVVDSVALGDVDN